MVLHRPGETVNVITRQLAVLGVSVASQWQPLDLKTTPADVVIVDADAGWPGVLPWISSPPKIPMIALLGSEAPNRIKWALDHGTGAIISKPVAASAIYPALVMAFHAHSVGRQQTDLIGILEERLRLRPVVLAAVRQMMSTDKYRRGNCPSPLAARSHAKPADARTSCGKPVGPQQW